MVNAMKVYMPPEVSPAEAHRAQVLVRDGLQCRMAHRGGCYGDTNAHHVIPRQVLRRELRGAPEWALDYAISDGRNGMMLCALHDPDRSARDWRPKFKDVPDQQGLIDFAEQYGLIGRLGRTFPEVAERFYGGRASRANEGGVRMQQEVPHREAEHFTMDIPQPAWGDETTPESEG